jgi:hypothetical protein
MLQHKIARLEKDYNKAMNTIKINYSKIRETIHKGDTTQGNYFLRVTPNGDSAIIWAENSRIWDTWNPEDYLANIPSYDPTGTGAEYEAGIYFLKQHGYEIDQIDAIADKLGVVDYVETAYAEEWQEEIQETLDFLADEFLDALNNDDQIWGYTAEEDGIVSNKPDFTFEWEK